MSLRGTVPFLCAALSAAPPLDDAHGPLLRAFPGSLRWDNVERLPAWCGETRTFRQGSLHVLRLREGQVLFLPMPAEGWLRVVPVSREARARLSVGQGDGAGLARIVEDRGDPRDRDALFGPGLEQPCLFRIACPQDGKGDLEVALFTARLEAAGPLPAYPERILLPGPVLKLRRHGDLQSEEWQSLPAHRAVGLEVDGPSRIQVEMRLQPGFELMRDGLRFTFQAALDAASGSPESIRTSVDIHEPLVLEGRVARLGRPEQRWVEVPPGRHRLTLGADHALLVRLHREGPGNYLMPGRNLPDPWLPGAVPPVSQRDSFRLGETEAIAADLRFREPGLSALAHLDQWRRECPENLALREARNRAAAEWTTFRSLLPDAFASAPLHHAFAWLHDPAATPLAATRKAGTPADLEQALAALPQVTFLPLAEDAVFSLDPREAPTELRLLVATSGVAAGQRLRVQLGDQPPIDLTLEAPVRLPVEWQAASIADLGLALAAQDHGWRAQPLLQGSERAPLVAPLPVVEASAARIPLPPDVRQVRVSCAGSPGSAPLQFALQLRTSTRPEVPSQGPALTDESALRAHLEQSEGEPPEARPWLPLKRWLAAQGETFRSRVAPDPVMAESLKGRPSPEAQALIARSRTLDGDGHRIAAVEAWAEAFRAATGPDRVEALAGLYRALRTAGESFLAEQWMKAALLYGEAPLQDLALAILEPLYRQSQAEASRLTLLAAAAQARPTVTRLVPLAAALLEDGQAAQALRVLTLMPPTAAPALWVRAGRLVRSETALNAGLKALQDPQERALWEGILSLDQGRESEALKAWEGSGSPGVPWRQARREALELLPRLREHPAAADLHETWSRWSQRHPGPWSWRPEPWLVREAAGALQLRNLVLDQVQAAFRCQLGRPVRLQVIGPLRLRVEAYPLHAAGAPAGLEGWLDIKGPGGSRSVPFTQNWPAPSLRVEGCAESLPGQRVQCDLDLPAGLHDLEISAGAASALILPSTYRPEVPLGPLPHRAPEALRALQAGAKPAPSLAAPLGALPGIYLAREVGFAEFGLNALRNLILAPLPEAPSWPRVEDRLALEGASEPDSGDPRAVAQQLDALAARARSHAAEQQACLALAEHLAARCPEALLHTSALDLLRRGALWTPAGSTGSGAGLRLLPNLDRQPSAAATRVRRALLADPGDRLLSGQEAAVFHFQQPTPWTLQVEAAPFVPALGPPLPAVLRISLDGQPQTWTLAPGETRVFEIAVPGGRHSVRIEQEAAYEGQWLRLRFPGGLGQGRLEVPPRSFEAGRADAPLRFRAEGPLWVRADRWRPEGIEPEYRYLPPGPQEWVLAPGPGEPEILCAFSYQEVIPDRVLPTSRPWTLALPPLPGRASVPGGDTRAPRTFQDAYPLGGQEDGTHTVRFRAFSRVDTARSRSEAPTQRALEIGYEHRFLAPDTERSYLGKARLRRLEGSGTSLSLGGSLEQPVVVNPLRAFGSLDLIVQAGAGPGASRARASSFELEGGLRLPFDLGRRTSHVPEVAVFWRTQGYEHVNARTQTQLDLDLWSPFRDRNPWGIKASESLRHRPWQDALLTVQASALLTRPPGESVTLALASLQGGWRQRLGPLEALVQGGVARYGSGALVSAPFTRSHVLAALEGAVWTSRQNLLTLAAEVRLDAQLRIWTGAISLGWSFGNGRGRRDFVRGERAFPQVDCRTLSGAIPNGWKELPR